jgi:hypothetical protein
MFQIVDLYGQAPFRDPAAPNLSQLYYNRAEATAFIIKDLEFAESNLRRTADNIGSKQSGRTGAIGKSLLEQSSIYCSYSRWPIHICKADMDKVIEYVTK